MNKINRKTLFLILLAVAVISMAVWYYIKPSFLGALSIGIMAGASLAAIGGFYLGWISVDPFIKARLKRKLTKKNYGIAYLIYDNKFMHPFLFNFTDNTFTINNKLYHLSNKKVMIENRNYEQEPISVENIVYLKNVPVVFINANTMEAIDLTDDPNSPPSLLGADILNYIDNEVYKKMIKQKFKQDVTFVIMLLLILIMAVGFWFIYSQNQQILKIIQHSGIAHTIIQNVTKH